MPLLSIHELQWNGNSPISDKGTFSHQPGEITHSMLDACAGGERCVFTGVQQSVQKRLPRRCCDMFDYLVVVETAPNISNISSRGRPDWHTTHTHAIYTLTSTYSTAWQSQRRLTTEIARTAGDTESWQHRTAGTVQGLHNKSYNSLQLWTQAWNTLWAEQAASKDFSLWTIAHTHTHTHTRQK